jgi:hypothetical protein
MSEDVSALTAMFGGVSQTYAPGTYGSVYDVGSVQGASPFPDSYQPPPSSVYSELMRAAAGIGAAGRSIGEGRAATGIFVLESILYLSRSKSSRQRCSL